MVDEEKGNLVRGHGAMVNRQGTIMYAQCDAPEPSLSGMLSTLSLHRLITTRT